jgi:ketosteroid isomerase-like protein
MPTLRFLEEFAAGWNTHDVDHLMTFMDDDREAFARVFKMVPDAHFADARHFVSGDRACSEWTFTGTAADGRRVEVRGCDLFTFRNGKIALKTSYFKNRTA